MSTPPLMFKPAGSKAWAWLGLSLLALAGHAQAQSSYVLATLKPAASSYPMPRAQQFVIENSDRVVSHSEYDLGYRLPLCIPGFGCFAGARTYAAHPVQWPASAATSVAPVKLTAVSLGGVPFVGAQGGDVGVAVSPDGRLFAGAANGAVFNAAGVLIAMDVQVVPNQSYSPQFDGGRIPKRGIDNLGVVVVNRYGQTYLWDVSSRLARTSDTTINDTMPLQPTLDRQGYPGARVNDMTSTDWMVGETWPVSPVDSGACEDNTSNYRCWPTVWERGQMRIIDQRPGRAVGTNDNKQLLIQRLNHVYTVWTRGTEQTIAPLTAGHFAIPSGMNAAGVVVGRSGSSATDAPDLYKYAGGRAFIWINGSTQDLTQYVKARGAKLPSGAVLEDARAINDKGSIVAVMRSSLGTRTTVRLTARP
jgi:hypothetical protein